LLLRTVLEVELKKDKKKKGLNFEKRQKKTRVLGEVR
jgi:hypothetical protein